MVGKPGPSNLKYVSLVVLIAQATALVLVLRYSRTVQTEGPRYLSSSAIFISEVVKFFTCFLVICQEHDFAAGRVRSTLRAEIMEKPGETAKVAVPAILYVVQNNLLFLALSKLDAATYQVTYQLKILTTALFSVTMLGRQLTGTKWVALVLLMVGVALVQMPAGEGEAERREGGWDGVVGVGAVLVACVSSGFSGVYFERILKASRTSLWIRNLQLAFFSIFGAFLMVVLYDWSKVTSHGLLQGYNWIIWIVIFLQAYGGLVIALVVKYADNILKGFAVSISIIISSLLSYFLLGDFEPTSTFIVGAGVVILSTFLYGYEPSPGAAGHQVKDPVK